MAKRPLLPVEFLRKILRYEPKSGKIFWLARKPNLFKQNANQSVEQSCAAWNARYAGREAGTGTDGHGYATCSLFGQPYQVHRIVWAMHTGEWPKLSLDHRDGSRKNNTFDNLREATCSENMRNRRPWVLATSKYLGVSRRPSRKKPWCATIFMGGRHINLGSFACEEDAARAYDEAARKHFREFARPNFP